MQPSKKKELSIVDWFVTLILLCSSSAMLVCLILPVLVTTPREKLQKELAIELGVEIQDYPYLHSFPSGYFHTVLKPGMTISEVHEIVRGYKKVLHCEDWAEVYYYFSTELEHAKRFMISYDEGKFNRFQGEDDDSRTIWTDGCLPGLIEE
jgi:hypothetical protein